MEQFPIADWVEAVAEGVVEYNSSQSNRKQLKEEFYQSQKMRIFLDANILVAVLNKEYPLFT